MPDWIYTLPDDLITLLAVVIVVGGVLIAGLCFRAILGPRTITNFGALLDSYRLMITLTGIVLAFSLVQAETNLRDVSSLIAREADTLDLVARELGHLQGPAVAELRARLVLYGEGILREEWPLLARGRHSRRLDGSFTELLHFAQQIQPGSPEQEVVYTEMLKNLDLLAYLRDERISDARERLPPVFWHAVELMTLVSILLAAPVPPSIANSFATLLPAAAIAVLIGLMAIIDVPFKGQSAVHPVELHQIISHLEPGGAPSDP